MVCGTPFTWYTDSPTFQLGSSAVAIASNLLFSSTRFTCSKSCSACRIGRICNLICLFSLSSSLKYYECHSMYWWIRMFVWCMYQPYAMIVKKPPNSTHPGGPRLGKCRLYGTSPNPSGGDTSCGLHMLDCCQKYTQKGVHDKEK